MQEQDLYLNAGPGAAPATVVPDESSVYVLESSPDADTLAARSPELTVQVAAPAALTVLPVRVPPGSVVTVSLGADPLLTGGTYVLEQQVGAR